jgi:hypothetical protein
MQKFAKKFDQAANTFQQNRDAFYGDGQREYK